MQPPAEIGMPLEAVDTPALLIDLDVYERNLQRLHSAYDTGKVRVRPHAKTHKCAAIALQQIALGAVGVCCQKVSEAAALVDGGVANVFVSNEIVGATKLERLAALARRAKVSVCVDHAQNVRDLAAAALRAGADIDVLVELDLGQGRCGVAPGAPAVALAREIQGFERLRFAGLHAYHGAAQHLRTPAERRAAIAAALEKVNETLRLLSAERIACAIVTGAGTGTFELEAASGVYNEIQPGSYIFMDADYSRNQAGADAPRFEQSLFVYATVMSRPTAERAVVDAGLKALAVDSGMPLVADLAGVEYMRASDEHGALALKEPQARLKVGDKLRLIPGHCDPTVNLHEWYVGVRNGRVETLWPIDARGAFF